jgi:8-oxo-dGTP diphosphatase
MRAQCIVCRGNKILLVRHRHHGEEWWCLPGGRVENGETEERAAVRELKEECLVEGTIVRQTSFWSTDTTDDSATTFLVDIGDQEPVLGVDPEFQGDERALIDMRWLALSEISERDRSFLWAAGLLSVTGFLAEVSAWGDVLSYPGH